MALTLVLETEGGVSEFLMKCVDRRNVPSPPFSKVETVKR